MPRKVPAAEETLVVIAPDGEQPDTSIEDAADAVTRASEALARVEEMLAAGEAHELAMHQEVREAQEQLLQAAIRRRAVRDCVSELGGICSDDVLVAEVEAAARAAARLVAQTNARLEEARIRVAQARDHQQLAQQSLLWARQVAYVQAHHPALYDELRAVRVDIGEENLSNSERARRHARSGQLSDEIRTLAEAAGIL
jgi:hypothetical protein